MQAKYMFAFLLKEKPTKILANVVFLNYLKPRSQESLGKLTLLILRTAIIKMSNIKAWKIHHHKSVCNVSPVQHK